MSESKPDANLVKMLMETKGMTRSQAEQAAIDLQRFHKDVKGLPPVDVQKYWKKK